MCNLCHDSGWAMGLRNVGEPFATRCPGPSENERCPHGMTVGTRNEQFDGAWPEYRAFLREAIQFFWEEHGDAMLPNPPEMEAWAAKFSTTGRVSPSAPPFAPGQADEWFEAILERAEAKRIARGDPPLPNVIGWSTIGKSLAAAPVKPASVPMEVVVLELAQGKAWPVPPGGNGGEDWWRAWLAKYRADEPRLLKALEFLEEQ